MDEHLVHFPGKNVKVLNSSCKLDGQLEPKATTVCLGFCAKAWQHGCIGQENSGE